MTGAHKDDKEKEHKKGNKNGKDGKEHDTVSIASSMRSIQSETASIKSKKHKKKGEHHPKGKHHEGEPDTVSIASSVAQPDPDIVSLRSTASKKHHKKKQKHEDHPGGEEHDTVSIAASVKSTKSRKHKKKSGQSVSPGPDAVNKAEGPTKDSDRDAEKSDRRQRMMPAYMKTHHEIIVNPKHQVKDKDLEKGEGQSVASVATIYYTKKKIRCLSWRCKPSAALPMEAICVIIVFAIPLLFFLWSLGLFGCPPSSDGYCEGKECVYQHEKSCAECCKRVFFSEIKLRHCESVCLSGRSFE